MVLAPAESTRSSPAQRGRGRSLLHLLERPFSWAFGADNPWHHLGALSFFLFWIITVSGVYVYAFFDTSADGAYRSVQRMTEEQWYLAGVMRSLHRYASDAFVAVMVVHLAKEFAIGHFRGFRWFSWLSGIPLVWLVYASGIGGYWLVWDQLAQFSIIATAEWLDAIPLLNGAIIRNFVASVDDRFFSLLMFLHIGIPLVLLLGMWVHIQRISRAKIFPPRALALGTLAALTITSLLHPAVSQLPADLTQVPSLLPLDWIYLLPHVVQYESSTAVLWIFAAGGTLALAALPAFARRTQPAPAVVSPLNCNGCGRCFADCPYAAVLLEPRTDGRPGQKIAVVQEDLCAGCGICAGACPSSTPFRSTDVLVTGIDLPERPITALRTELEEALKRLQGSGKIIVFGCDYGADVHLLRDANTATIGLVCTGMLAPSFIEYALRSGADGVLVTGCAQGECEYRLGPRWTEQRIAGTRAPRLRANVPAERLRIVWAAAGEEDRLRAELATFRAMVREIPAAVSRPSSPARRAAARA